MKSLQTFVPPDQEQGFIHTENSLEFIRACEDVCWNHDRSTPMQLRNQRNCQKRSSQSEEGTPAFLVQSGLSECFCYLRDTQDTLADVLDVCQIVTVGPLNE